MHMSGLFSIAQRTSRCFHSASRTTNALAAFALTLAMTGVLALQAGAENSRFNKVAGNTSEKIESETIGPKTAPLPAGPYKVRIETTHGIIDVELFPKQAPLSVTNFLQLVDSKFYNGTVFHRVVANFMIQTGGYDAKLLSNSPANRAQ